MLNKVMLIGRLGRDPESSCSESGLSISKFSLATDRYGKGGEKGTDWHKIVAFKKTADFCNVYLCKGDLVYCEGSLRTRDWVDKQGMKHSTTEVLADVVRGLGKKSSEESLINERDGLGGSKLETPTNVSRDLNNLNDLDDKDKGFTPPF